MATEAQIHANRENAQHSTGPVTAEGKSHSSKNALTLGLYTRQDYVKPDEREIYKQFCETMYRELAPATLLEQSLAAEITGASWRLRRCSAVEGELADYRDADPMLDEASQKTIRSIERARASAHSLLHRSVNQLRRLQTDRLTAATIFHPEPAPACLGISDTARTKAALNSHRRAQTPPPGDLMARIEAFCEPTPDFIAALDAELAARASQTQTETESASFCTDEIASETAAPQTPRNAPCPCRSGQKYKRCCGRNAPPVLGNAA